jgi:polysaccharide export outer membrane protein
MGKCFRWCRGATVTLFGALAATIWLPAAAVTLAQSPATAPAQAEHVIGVQDILNVSVWEHEDLDGKFTVQPDGTVTLPLVGRLAAAGLTIREFETELVRALSEGFIRQPRVAITFDQIRGRRVFIFGNVAAPGTYPLAEGQTLIEALAKAGYGVASEAVVVRPKQPSGPKLPEHASDGEVLRVNLRELEKDVQHGSLGRNVILHDGDTVFVPRDDPTRIFVTGHVRNPGAYSIAEGTTVLQALALAGGATEEAAINRLKVLRIVGGKQQSIKVKLTDSIRAGDTLVIPERFF